MLLPTRAFPVNSEELDHPLFISTPDLFIEYTYILRLAFLSCFYKFIIFVITNGQTIMSNSEEPSTSTPPSNSSHTSTMHSQGLSDVTQPSRVPMSDDIKEQSQIEALKFEKSSATDSHVDDGSASQIAQTQKISPGKISIRSRKISPSPQRPFMQQKKGSKMPPSQQNNESFV